MHVLFALGAAYLIVQTFSARQKTTFASPGSTNSEKHVLEHKVQMQKKQQTMSAPAAMQRITTTATNAKVTLPPMPVMSALSNQLTPTTMAGMGGSGVGLQMGGGGAQGNGDSAGGGLNLFGMQGGKGLKGTFYDLKQTPAKTPTHVTKLDAFVHELNAFLLAGWQPGSLNKYFKSPTTLYANQIFVPRISSAAAPKAFGVEKDVEPRYWMALYRGQVSPPESGTYHFVGGGDNILIVRFSGKIVLDRSWNYQSKFGIDASWKAVADYDYKFGHVPGGFAKGQPLELKAGEFYDMEVLLGDDGGVTHFSLLVEKEGVEYMKTSEGLPILPVFRTASEAPPPGSHPPFQASGPVWKSRETATSSF